MTKREENSLSRPDSQVAAATSSPPGHTAGVRFALAAGVVACLVLPLQALSTTARPAIAVAGTNPLSVRGSRFHAGERVTVTAWVTGRHVRIVRAGSSGSYTARFRAVVIESCQAYVIKAVGSRGSRASVKRTPECPPPLPLDGLFPLDPRKPG